jgi:hypothetical protein
MGIVAAIIVAVCAIGIVISDYVTKDPHNPVEQVAEQVIEKELGK